MKRTDSPKFNHKLTVAQECFLIRDKAEQVAETYFRQSSRIATIAKKNGNRSDGVRSGHASLRRNNEQSITADMIGDISMDRRDRAIVSNSDVRTQSGPISVAVYGKRSKTKRTNGENLSSLGYGG
ncbi:hypothetical protein GWI33_000208 [Rhynchophorus ferrugineus]|uniref:Uncharacterized protein n=1 Tax=Rhynchophorus ferrugineus TaxID=354439 RepID=A0A834IYJ8_RHYFE|nr:hypothetical protein GWI33_000208 [Rhynchophorus ferrugineus]